MNLDNCLPVCLQGPDTTITTIAAGFSGAGVYRVEAAGQRFVLKISSHEEPSIAWRRKVEVQRLAADAGVAPPVIHVDEARRAVLSAFVTDRSFLALFGNPQTRDMALGQLGRTLRVVHELPLSSETVARDARVLLTTTWARLDGTFPVPQFVSDAIRGALGAEVPASDRPVVLSHNDVNPTNLVHDGERLLLLDWETAGPNDPLYDLAAVAVFLRLDDGACQHLIASHDGLPTTELPPRFDYFRRLVPVMCGAVFVDIARAGGHSGVSGDTTFDSAPSLGDCYQQMRGGALNMGTAEGRLTFGLALIKEGIRHSANPLDHGSNAAAR